ncbi:MAG: efflux RND transporter permease subunit [Bacteroidales bacterium]|nr:efflux RND transporter permease subunit [Bacteroidales bacterium]
MNKKRKGVVEWTMHHYKIVLLLFAFLVGLGIFALPNMPKKEYPDFTIRNALVLGIYPGASSEQVEEQLTVPLEDLLLSYKGVDRNKTYSLTRDGLVYFILDLDESEDSPRNFYANLRMDLEEFKVNLPSGVLPLMVLSEFGETSAILITLESESLSYKSLEDLLATLEGKLRPLSIVTNIKSYGHQKEQANLYLDKEKMAAYAINAQQVMTQLYSGGLVTSAGSLHSTDGFIPIHMNNSFESELEILEQPIYFDESGNVLRVRDLGYIVREYPEPMSYITNNGRKCLLLSVEMTSGYNMVELGKEVDKVLKEFQEELPPDVHIFRISDQPHVVSDSVYSFLRDMLISILSVIAVMIIMLPMRVASVAATSIPITIFISIGIMYVFGFEINTVTLASLLVVLGMVVDDSIVVIDNYLNYLDHGMSRWKASITAANSYFRSIFSATMAISITFFPFLFTLPEVFVEFMFMAPWAIFISLMVSMGVAMLYIPYFQYFTIRKGIQHVVEKQRKKSKRGISVLELFGVFYEKTLQKAFAHPTIVVIVIILFLILPFFVYQKLPKRLMPMADRNQFVIEIYLPYGSSLKETECIADSLRMMIQDDERIHAITSFIGTSAPRFQASYTPQIPGPHFAQFIVNTPSYRITEELVKEFQQQYKYYFPGTYVRVRQLDYSMLTDNEVEVRLIGENKEALMLFADSLQHEFVKIPYIASVRSDFGGYQYGMNLQTDPVSSSRVGINPGLLSLHMASRFSGIPVTSIIEGGQSIPVVVHIEGQEGTITAEEVGNEYFHGVIPGAAVPLRQVATLEPEWNISQIVRRNGYPTLTLMMDLDYGKISTDVFHKVKAVMDNTTMPEGIRYEYAGTYKADKTMMPGIIKGVVTAVLLIFLILLFHFKKVSLAALVLGSTALSILGALFGTWLLNLPISLTTYLGIVTLVGLVVRNGIIMFDYAELLRGQGYSVKEASFMAGCRRIRPIFQTSSSTAVAVIPMLITKDSLWAPMAATIFFGVFTSMFFVSVFMPVIYWIVYRKK